MERALNWKRSLVVVLLVACLAAPAVTTFVGCSTVASVGKHVTEWIVSFATETGKYIGHKATAFADAVAAAWKAFWGTDKINNVKLDQNDPLRGKYDGILQCKAEWKGTENGKERQNEMSIKLDHPRMIRTTTESTEWELAPEERACLDDLQKQLMAVT